MQEKNLANKTTTKKATAKTSKTTVKEKNNETVAVFSSSKLFHSSLGRLENGYNVVDLATAKEWMKISNKVREASPQEVASAYGV